MTPGARVQAAIECLEKVLAGDRAERVVALETEIAAQHWDNVRSRDSQATYNPMAWDDAIAYAAERIAQLQSDHGRDAFAAYLGNPTAHNLGAAWGDIGEHRRLRFECDVWAVGRKFGGAGEQPAAQRVEAGPVRRGNPGG